VLTDTATRLPRGSNVVSPDAEDMRADFLISTSDQAYSPATDLESVKQSQRSGIGPLTDGDGRPVALSDIPVLADAPGSYVLEP
jgi:hypothetical protein